MLLRSPRSTLFPYTTLFRSYIVRAAMPGFRTVEQRNIAVTADQTSRARSEEHTSELQSRFELVCRLLLAKKNCLLEPRRSRSIVPLFRVIRKSKRCSTREKK